MKKGQHHIVKGKEGDCITVYGGRSLGYSMHFLLSSMAQLRQPLRSHTILGTDTGEDGKNTHLEELNALLTAFGAWVGHTQHPKLSPE